MKLCYCDESGTGQEPYAVLVGVVVDTARMHVTKDDWSSLLARLSNMVGQEFRELHTRLFYSGSGIWKSITGQQRSDLVDYFIDWFAERKHHVVFSAISKSRYKQLQEANKIHPEIDTVWKALAFHVALAVQRNFQKEPKNKGNTIFVFDEEVKEEPRFQQLILQPPKWSESYYAKKKNREPFCQVVDAPYFADSKNVGLLQVADFLAYFIRRYIEIAENEIPEKYSGESTKVAGWFRKIKSRSIPYASIYPKSQRCATAELYWELAPACIRDA